MNIDKSLTHVVDNRSSSIQVIDEKKINRIEVTEKRRRNGGAFEVSSKTGCAESS
jgi:hypothetical protein